MGITFPSFCYHENTYCIQTCSPFTSSLLDEAKTPNWGGGWWWGYSGYGEKGVTVLSGVSFSLIVLPW